MKGDFARRQNTRVGKRNPGRGCAGSGSKSEMMQMLLRHGRTWYCAVVAAFLLTACAAPQKIGGNASEAAFERAGRFAVTVNYFGGKHEAVQGGFAWHDTGHAPTSALTNPLGTPLERVRGRKT